VRGLIRCSVVRNSSWFKALQDECDALRGMLANTEAVLAEERRSRLAAEKSDKHNAEDARKLAELRRRLASGAHRAKKVEKLLCPSDDAKVGLGLAEAGTLAAKDRREANNRIVELQAQLVAVQGQHKLPHVVLVRLHVVVAALFSLCAFRDSTIGPLQDKWPLPRHKLNS
jgi:hypothetical protein